MAPPCLFCTKPATTKEHIIPAWLAKASGLQGAFLGPTTEDARKARNQPISFKSHRKRFFCEECQVHFKHLEDDVKPLIEPMCKGGSVTLDHNAQRLVARWAAKTGFALIASEPAAEDVVPEWQRHALRKSDSPPDGVWVAFTQYQGLAQKDVQTNLDENAGDTDQPPRDLYSAFLSFEPVAFKVFGVSKVWADDRWYQYRDLITFWPTIHDVIEWPPSRGITGKAIKSTCDVIPLVGYVQPGE